VAESVDVSSSVVMLSRQSLRLVATKHHHFQDAMRHGQVIGFASGVVLFHKTTSRKRERRWPMSVLRSVGQCVVAQTWCRLAGRIVAGQRHAIRDIAGLAHYGKVT
jgi:hypothetical protein